MATHDITHALEYATVQIDGGLAGDKESVAVLVEMVANAVEAAHDLEIHDALTIVRTIGASKFCPEERRTLANLVTEKLKASIAKKTAAGARPLAAQTPAAPEAPAPDSQPSAQLPAAEGSQAALSRVDRATRDLMVQVQSKQSGNAANQDCFFFHKFMTAELWTAFLDPNCTWDTCLRKLLPHAQAPTTVNALMFSHAGRHGGEQRLRIYVRIGPDGDQHAQISMH